MNSTIGSRPNSNCFTRFTYELQSRGDALTVEGEVPGFEAKDLQINVEPRRLTISGKKETKEDQKKGKVVYQEQCSNEILRVIDLQAEVIASKAAATLKNGMFELQMPKSPRTKGTHVEVKPA
jgi:HSP20 family protein